MISTDRDWMLLSLFVYEVKSLTEEIDGQRSNLIRYLANEDSKSIFSSIKILLLISAQLSFIFHPKEKYSARAHYMRKGFNLDSDIDFLGDRSIRNHIAHMDERLHDWHATSKNYNMIRGVLGSRNGISGPGASVRDIFEHYIPEEGVFVFRGEEYNLRRLFIANSRLNQRACAILDHHWKSREFRGIFRQNVGK